MKLGTLLHLFKSTGAAAGEGAPAAAEGHVVQPFAAVLHETRTPVQLSAVSEEDDAASAQPMVLSIESEEGDGLQVGPEETPSAARPDDSQVLTLLQRSSGGEPDSLFPTPDAVRNAFRRILVAATQPLSSQSLQAAPQPEGPAETASGLSEPLAEEVIVTEAPKLKSHRAGEEDTAPTHLVQQTLQPAPGGAAAAAQSTPVVPKEADQEAQASGSPPTSIQLEVASRSNGPDALHTGEPKAAVSSSYAEIPSSSAQLQAGPVEVELEAAVGPAQPEANVRVPMESESARVKGQLRGALKPQPQESVPKQPGALASGIQALAEGGDEGQPIQVPGQGTPGRPEMEFERPALQSLPEPDAPVAPHVAEEELAASAQTKPVEAGDELSAAFHKGAGADHKVLATSYLSGEKPSAPSQAEARGPGPYTGAPDDHSSEARRPAAQPVDAPRSDVPSAEIQESGALPGEAREEIPSRLAHPRPVDKLAFHTQGTSGDASNQPASPATLHSATPHAEAPSPAAETLQTVQDAETLSVPLLIRSEAVVAETEDAGPSPDEVPTAGSKHADDAATLTDRPVAKTARRHSGDAWQEQGAEDTPERLAAPEKIQTPTTVSLNAESAPPEARPKEKAAPELAETPLVEEVPVDERVVAPPTDRATPQAERSAAMTSERSDFQGRPVPAAWLRTILGGARSLTTLQQGWQVMQFNLDEGDGTVTIRARREDGRVAVSVGFSDPELRALAVASADRLQEALQNEYEAPVDLSLFSGDAGEPGQEQNGAQGSRRRRGPASTADVDAPAEAKPRSTMPLGTRHEWVG